MSSYEDQRLLDYYKDRRVWVLTIEGGHSDLQPYPK
jgi:hypothetical protein